MSFDGIHDDEWSDHVMAGEAYSAEALVLAVAGMVPLSQLLNPASSNTRIRLRCVESMAFFGGAINMNVRRDDVALPSVAVPLFGPPQNLLGGGPAPVAQLRFDNALVASGLPFWLVLALGNTRRGYPVEHLDWGHDLLESQGVSHSGTVGGFLILGYQWAEVRL